MKKPLSSTRNALQTINMLWVGDALSSIEQLSMQSYLNAGHPVRLFSYQPVEGVPEKVMNEKALELMTRSECESLKYPKTSSYALAADLFRYRLMSHDAGIWSDADFVCLRPLDLPPGNIFGWQTPESICNGLLYLPKDSPVLEQLLNLFSHTSIPPWLSVSRRSKLWLRRHFLRQDIAPNELPWGTFGPKALTWLIRQCDLTDDAQPIDTFYSHPLSAAERIFDKDYDIPQLKEHSTLVVHLWNEKIKYQKNRIPEPGSVLDRFYKQFDIQPES